MMTREGKTLPPPPPDLYWNGVLREAEKLEAFAERIQARVKELRESANKHGVRR